MSAKNESPSDQLIDLLVYAPVGIALEALDNLPKYVERGRSQVTLGRFFAKTAAQRGSNMAETFGERVANEAGQVIVDFFGIDLAAEEPAADTGVDAKQPPPPVVSGDSDLPIGEYDSQAATQIIKLLAQLTPQEREQIATYEADNRNRVTVLRKIEQLRKTS